MITAERLRELLHYNVETGEFTWRDAPSKSRYSVNPRAGKRAGCRAANGYIVIFCDGRLYHAHRLAWLYVHGRWPAAQIDHENRKRDDNRFANLREASAAQQNANKGKRKDSVSGVKGVYLHGGTGKWRARLRVAGKTKHLGYFTTKEEASAAYSAAAIRHFGEFARAA